MIHLILGDSGSGKSKIFSELDQAKFALVDADKKKGEWSNLDLMVDAAIHTGKIVVLSVTRGISTYMGMRPDLKFRLYFVDVPLETIVENRRLRAKDPSKEVDVERVQSRIKRLNSIFNNPKWNDGTGVRGDYNFILAELRRL